LTDWIELYLAERQHQAAPSSLSRYAYWLKLFAAFCQDFEAEHLSPAQLDQFRQHLLWRRNALGRLDSPNTVDQGLRTVRGFLRWATQRGFLARDPSQNLMLGRPPQPVQRVLTVEELERLVEAPDGSPHGLRDRAILALCLSGLLSRAQLSGLDVADIDLARRLVRVEGEWRDLAEAAYQALDQYLSHGRASLAAKPDAALFIGSSGRRLQEPAIAARFIAHGRKAGLGGLSVRVVLRSARGHQEAFLQRRFG